MRVTTILTALLLLFTIVVSATTKTTTEEAAGTPFNPLLYSCMNDGSNSFKVVLGQETESVATALFDGFPNATGWIYLSINTSSAYTDAAQAQCAGYLEGYLTYQAIYFGRINYYKDRLGFDELPANLTAWIEDNIAWIYTNIDKYTNSESQMDKTDSLYVYWYQISLIMNQIESMLVGYTDAIVGTSLTPVTLADLFAMNMAGDMFDVIPAIQYMNGESLKPPATFVDLMKSSHCTALVKLTDDLSELYCGHVAWYFYSQMLRVFKSYTFGFSATSQTVGNHQLFSAYPATLSSIDDFYVLNTQLSILETTNNIFNFSLYENVRPQSVLSWMRVLVSNRLSTSGLQWCETVSLYNSGTYNNQWMVIDFKKFTPNVSLADGALYVLEQIPGYIEYADQTAILRMGYWPSYNVPFYETIYNMSGYNSNDLDGSLRQEMSYIGNARAMIMRRDANKVYSVEDYQMYIQYNDYETDPLAQDNPGNAIASRFDLLQQGPIAMGGIDGKMTSWSMVQKQTALAICGPTRIQQPSFTWDNEQFASTSHVGLPTSYEFDWVEITKDTFTPYVPRTP
ncbi:hypothetical protein SAMD00019534_069050, partial [Acytostelium subglobosum LB1]|uniref:hypothetical protein n=1 Tax=Acytostelium subglobosum LB1 TaxID=1410327 RepID=UPI0006447DA4